MAMKYTHLLFDADNTLFDFNSSSARAFAKFIDHLNLDEDKDYYAIYQIGNHQVWNKFEAGTMDTMTLKWKRFELFFKALNIQSDPHEANSLYLKFLVEFASLIPGARKLLEDLKSKGYRLSIITNGLKEVQKPRINKIEIAHFFESIIVSDEIDVAKPNPSFFQVTADSIGHPPKEKVLVIGDSLSSDITGGNNYGYDTCWYNPGNKKNNTSAKPTYVIDELSKLMDII